MQDMKLAEASASQAAAQLLAEEQQAAARVAAKKAKKLRQKQAKEQLLLPEPAQLQDAQPSARSSAAAHTGSPKVDTDSSDSASGQPMPTEQSELGDVSANGSVELSDGTADTVGAIRSGTSDADFLRSLFCCPITHVRPQPAFSDADGIESTQQSLQVYIFFCIFFFRRRWH